MQHLSASEDPALFPVENPNPVMRAGPDGKLLYANGASAELLATWGAPDRATLPAAWRERIARALESGERERVEAPCGSQVFHLDLVPIRDRDYVDIYGRDVMLPAALIGGKRLV